MTAESDFIALLRGFATAPGARGLLDDAALLDVTGKQLVLTHDMIVEGVHFLPGDSPGDVAWKLLAVNLSDLAAKGAKPVGALLGYGLGDPDWDRAFAMGLRSALDAFEVPLLGGDTVSMPQGSARCLGLTAIGEASGPVPSRSGAGAGDALWVTGTIGDAGAGLAIARGAKGPEALAERYRRPMPRLETGMALAPIVSAMMDVSDGLLIDAARMASASGLAVEIALERVPLSAELTAMAGSGRGARLSSATAGDDYELLFAAPPEASASLATLATRLGLPFTQVGSFKPGSGLLLTDGGEEIALPDRLGWEHG